MLQELSFRVPVKDRDPDAVKATLTKLLARVAEMYPALRGMRLEAAEGVLEIVLRVAGRNRWTIQGDAKRILTWMMLRLKLDDPAVLHRVTPIPDIRSQTKEEGRVARAAPRPRGLKHWDDMYPWWDGVDSPTTPAEPH
jgi:hypothetical protein